MKRISIESALGRQEIKLGDVIHAYTPEGKIVHGTLLMIREALEDIYGDIPGTEKFAVNTQTGQVEVSHYLNVNSQ